MVASLIVVCCCFMVTVPAIRGKDYGKSKMRYPDYTETDSGLQYKVIHAPMLYLKPVFVPSRSTCTLFRCLKEYLFRLF